MPKLSSKQRDAILATYATDRLDPSPAAWEEVFAAAAKRDHSIRTIEIAAPRRGQEGALREAMTRMADVAARHGGETLALNPILQPGTGDLLSDMHFAGGTMLVIAWPSRAAWLEALLDPAWKTAHAERARAMEDLRWLVAGEDTIPKKFRRLIGPARPASDFRTPRVDGKTPGQLLHELLEIYPDGGADPSRRQLETLLTAPGFRDRPVQYLNLYDFGDGSDPNVGGDAEHRAYGRTAMKPTQAHGAHPVFRADIAHVLKSPVPWSIAVLVQWPSLAVFTDLRLDPEYITAQEHRVASSRTYGNYMTFKPGPAPAPKPSAAERAPQVALAAIGLLNLARGAFHWLAPDSGAGSVAGMNLDYPNRKDVVFLLGSSGISQLVTGVIDLVVAGRHPDAVRLMLGGEAARSGLVLATEKTFKGPVKPVPGRFAHAGVAAFALLALLIGALGRKRRHG